MASNAENDIIMNSQMKYLIWSKFQVEIPGMKQVYYGGVREWLSLKEREQTIMFVLAHRAHYDVTVMLFRCREE